MTLLFLTGAKLWPNFGSKDLNSDHPNVSGYPEADKWYPGSSSGILLKFVEKASIVFDHLRKYSDTEEGRGEGVTV